MGLSSKTGHQNKSKTAQRLKDLQRRLRARNKRIQQQILDLERVREENKQAEEDAKIYRVESELLKAQLNQTQLDSPPTNETLEAFCNERGIRDHTFGARMISLCINLAKSMSFGAIPVALATMFDALGLSVKIPSHDTIEHWCKRVGLNQIEKLREHHDDIIWIVDHSNQIGQEKLFVVLQIRASELPPHGKTLTLDQLTVLAIVPGKNWKRDDVREAYKAVAKQCGMPKYLICDGAVELRESVDVLEKAGKKVIVLRDLKHVAANQLKKLLDNTERFKDFTAKMGTTRSQIQQTELAHLNPPSMKTKARFMNIKSVVQWGILALFSLDNPDSETLKGIAPDRLRTKLDWVYEFRNEIMAWSQCMDVLGKTLKWINKQGLCPESGAELEAYLLAELGPIRGSLAAQLQDSLTNFVSQQASQLGPGDRAWLSSEAIESVFGLYKRREAQHSKSGFTGLVVSIPTLLKKWMPEDVREALTQTKNKHVKEWTNKHFGKTVAGRKADAYKEMRKKRDQHPQAA